VPEEIFRVCIFCRREFNVEWQGIEVDENNGVCGHKSCIEQHKRKDDLPDRKKKRKKKKQT